MPFPGAFAKSEAKSLSLWGRDKTAPAPRAQADPLFLGMKQKHYFSASAGGEGVLLAPGHGQRCPALRRRDKHTPLALKKGQKHHGLRIYSTSTKRRSVAAGEDRGGDAGEAPQRPCAWDWAGPGGWRTLHPHKSVIRLLKQATVLSPGLRRVLSRAGTAPPGHGHPGLLRAKGEARPLTELLTLRAPLPGLKVLAALPQRNLKPTG